MPFLSHFVHRHWKTEPGEYLTTSAQPVGIWSYRKVGDYVGPVWRVVRSSDLEEINIYPKMRIGPNKWMADYQYMETWAGGSTIYLTKWSDQSGNGYHYTQAVLGTMPTWDSTNKYWYSDAYKMMTTTMSVDNGQFTDSLIVNTIFSATGHPKGGYGQYHFTSPLADGPRFFTEQMLWNDATYRFLLYRGDGTASNRTFIGGTNAAFAAAGLSSISYDAAGRDYKFQVDRLDSTTANMQINQYSTAVTETVVAGSAVPTTNFNSVLWGTISGGGGNAFCGGIKERILYSTQLSSGDKTILDSFQNNFWSLW